MAQEPNFTFIYQYYKLKDHPFLTNVSSSINLSTSRSEDPPSFTAFFAISANSLARFLLSSPTITSLTAPSTFSLLMKSPTTCIIFFTPTLTPNCSAPTGHVTIGRPAATPSNNEFHPQCVKNPPIALCSSISTCGAHPRIINPFPLVFSSNPSEDFTAKRVMSMVPWLPFLLTTQTKSCPDISKPAAISISCSFLKLDMVPKAM
ncbi:unnamed protein product [Arabidopsis thaliana]|uniref:Uncharacterized protein n=1 Tax=Arabidopsis thaliana TaxID=3702 RepID=A0A654FVE3_ARATH|nr:unnamed protein product [Arabidopsis thaliana]